MKPLPEKSPFASLAELDEYIATEKAYLLKDRIAKAQTPEEAARVIEETKKEFGIADKLIRDTWFIKFRNEIGGLVLAGLLIIFAICMVVIFSLMPPTGTP